MWFALILACNVNDPTDCTTIISNMVDSQRACEAVIADGYDAVSENLPESRVIIWRCDTWGEAA